jgi:transposase
VVGHPPQRDCRPLLAVRRLLPEQYVLSSSMYAATLAMPPVGALSLRATVNQSRRFARSKTVEAHLGLTPRRFQCGETDHDGKIS